jgi:hypothetical protein
MIQVMAVVRAKVKLYTLSVHRFHFLNCAEQLEMTHNQQAARAQVVYHMG